MTTSTRCMRPRSPSSSAAFEDALPAEFAGDLRYCRRFYQNDRCAGFPGQLPAAYHPRSKHIRWCSRLIRRRLRARRRARRVPQALLAGAARAEVVWRDARVPDYIGDMPHTWIGAEFATAIRQMLTVRMERSCSSSAPLRTCGGGLHPAPIAHRLGLAHVTAKRRGSRATIELGLTRPSPERVTVRYPGALRALADGAPCMIDGHIISAPSSSAGRSNSGRFFSPPMTAVMSASLSMTRRWRAPPSRQRGSSRSAVRFSISATPGAIASRL